MVIETKKFKEVCATILVAIDNSENSTTGETLELKTEGKELQLNVTNGEYFASVKFPLDHEEKFEAAVNASKFLKLIASSTTENIEMSIKDTHVLVKTNGTYKVPLIMNAVTGDILKLAQIKINNATLDMKVSGAILQSILNYNSKELLRGTVSRPVQKMFYVDQEGCITFTSGACVNNFTLEKPVKLLFSQRLVRLFKLFKNDMVDFTLGYDPVSEELVQTKVRFQSPTITITAITGCNDDLLNTVPVAAIRGRANAAYDHNVVVGRKELLAAINRLLIFNAKDAKPYGEFVCNDNSMTIYDSNKENQEILLFKNDTKIDKEYKMTLDLEDLKIILETIPEEYITLSFGNHVAVVIKRPTISNVVPECKTA